MLRAAGFERALALSFLGDKTWAGTAFVREAARVVRVVGAVLVAAAGLWVAALALFLGTASSAAFSLSSLDNSSLLRFFARVAFGSLVSVALPAGAVAMAFVAGAAGLDVVVVVGVVRGLRVAGAGAGAFFAVAAFTGAASAILDASSRSIRDIWRLVAGMRLTRRSRRD